MANFSARKFMSRSLILLLLTYINTFFTCHGSSVLQSVCSQTKDPSLCLAVLGSDSRSRSARLAQLAQIAIDMAEYEAIGTKGKIHGLLMAAKDPKSKSLYENCENMYLDALAALGIAPDYLARRRYGDLGAQGVLVRDNVGRCGSLLLVVKPPFAKEIREVEILGDSIAVISQDLSRGRIVD
ncbi:pectinesterase inhibitor-like [Dorcoceras hygrometricum]|uniref:Pectinesterase inhibitor-like n=1 Tax=Dorcoceras hygrometricum TaxID=472368 RepID=A0A2Z7BH60_9LAMI|nr:pectinesterase inhibitor-like [Dorcoceras hygrometricum]